MDGRNVEVILFTFGSPAVLDGEFQPMDVMEVFFKGESGYRDVINGNYSGSILSVQKKIDKIIGWIPTKNSWYDPLSVKLKRAIVAYRKELEAVKQRLMDI